MEKEKLELNLESPCGNIFFILGCVYNIMKKQNRLNEFKAIQDYVLVKPYAQALVKINEYVELVDIGTENSLARYLKQGEKMNKEEQNG